MDPDRKKIIARALAAASILLFVLSTAGMLAKLEPFYTEYYSFAWWSFIIFIQSALFLRQGKCLLFDETGKFLILLPLSATAWLVFEAFNFRLSNWQYVNVPSSLPERWTGYFIAYSTVLPGIFSTMEMLKSIGAFKNSSLPRLPDAKSLHAPFLAVGLACFVLPLTWPQFFFPLVWIAFIFLLEPLNHRLGAPSLLKDFEDGTPRDLYLLLLAGLVCGILWETWNFKAGAKWVYSIPHLGFLKVFEMPVLGFLGFPPFAVECHAITASFFALLSRIGKGCPACRARLYYVIIAMLMLLFDLLVMAGIDRLTVVSYQG